jgi:putative SOS response-associated peptidase YedK
MCGRFIITGSKNLTERFSAKVENNPLFTDSYNISPGINIPVVYERESEKLLSLMRWGFVPHWTKDESIGARLINIRAETIDQKPSFISSFKHRRCLIPASGFYEWKKTASGSFPYFITVKDRGLFSFAGLYDEWKNSKGEIIKTCGIITTVAQELLQPIHDRMPVIIRKESEDGWIDVNSDKSLLNDILNKPVVEGLNWYPVSRMVNSLGNDTRELIEEIE